VAGEASVPFFSMAGSEFMEITGSKGLADEFLDAVNSRASDYGADIGEAIEELKSTIIDHGGMAAGELMSRVKSFDNFMDVSDDEGNLIRNDCLLPATGFFPIKEAVILLDSIVCYWQQVQSALEYPQIGDTYTMSGIDMINYTKSQPLRDVLDRMYKCLLRSGKFPCN
jgi:hypothetical protein